MQTFSINGQLCSEDEAKIPVTDHGFLYGDGVFEGLRFYGKRILKLSDHLRRLQDSADALSLKLPFTSDEMKSAIEELVATSEYDNGYLRVIVTRGRGPLGIDPRQCEPGNFIVIADQLTMVSDLVRSEGAKLIIASTRRLASDQLDSRIKSLNYLNQIMARLEANTAGADEAVVLNQRGFVAEGTADNLFIVKDNCLYTPPVTDGALEGITRAIILDLSLHMPIEVRECSLSPFDLYTADECFLSGTGAELIPVREVSGRLIKHSPGPVFRQIEKCFQEELQADRLFA